MFNQIWPQLALVAVGGLIAIAGTLSSSWLTARLTERRQRGELLQRMHEIVGRHEAISGRSSDNVDRPLGMRSMKELFGTDQPSNEQIAITIGLAEKMASQTEEHLKMAAESESRARVIEARTAVIEANCKALVEEHRSKELKLEEARERLARLETIAALLEIQVPKDEQE